MNEQIFRIIHIFTFEYLPNRRLIHLHSAVWMKDITFLTKSIPTTLLVDVYLSISQINVTVHLNFPSTYDFVTI